MKIVPSIYLLLALSVGWQSAIAQSGSDDQGAKQISSAPEINSPADPGGGTPAAQQAVPPSYRPAAPITYTTSLGSTYIPLDNWVYPALDRLEALGYLDSAYLGIRPWTRLSIAHMLQETADRIEANVNDDEAREIFLAVQKEVALDQEAAIGQRTAHAEFDSAYTTLRGITGTPLRDSFHLGQTITNDYGRPYEEGFNNYTGASARAEAGRFSFYFRGEYQHAPGATGYSLPLAMYLSNTVDDIPFASNQNQETIPLGPISSVDTFRIQEVSLSYHIIGHEISFGKNDHWYGPAQGGSMAWSNNAENIYAFQIDRVEPLRIPLLSRITGPFRYQFFVGSLQGHTAPNSPWVHAEKVSFKPTRNLEMGFERTVIWGGEDHTPITIHSFLKSFFSVQNVSAAEKFSRNDPGARWGSFDFNYRLPFVRNWLSLYTDSVAHDEVNPISAPRRSAVRPGIYLSHFPVLTHLDLRVEGASTDPVSNPGGGGIYYEVVQQQGTTNKGSLFSDPIGRDAKGGQAWLTYHLSPSENIQFDYRNAKVDQQFIKGGTTQNDYEVSVVKRVMKDIEIRGRVQYEEWKAPIYKPGQQSDTLISGQITWFPKNEKKSF